MALSAMLTAATRLPGAEGVSVTVIVQESVAASEPGERGQVLVSAKSPALAPVTDTAVMVKAIWPVLVRVMVWGEPAVSIG